MTFQKFIILNRKAGEDGAKNGEAGKIDLSELRVNGKSNGGFELKGLKHLEMEVGSKDKSNPTEAHKTQKIEEEA